MDLPIRYIKGWGYEDWIANNSKYCGKILHFKKGKRCSLHYHKIKDETFYLLSGRLELVLSDSLEDFKKQNLSREILERGQLVYIWPGRIHQMIALENSDLLEISTQHLESDSYRLIKGD